jgi:hypothetical protein
MRWILIIIGTFLFFSQAALSYTLMRGESGVPIRWPGKVKLEILGNPKNQSGISPEAFRKAAIHSLQVWQEASPEGVGFAYWQGSDPKTYEPSNQYNGVSSVYFASNDLSGDSGVDSGVIGMTQVWFYPDSGEIIETDIVLNDIHFSFGKNVDLQDVLTHEMGHALGLSHSGSIHSTMLHVSASDQKHLSCDDQLGIQALFGSPVMDETGGLKGKVQGLTGEAVLGVQVKAISRRRGNVLASVLTDKNGDYIFENLEAGDYFIAAEPFHAGPSALPVYYWGMNHALCSGSFFEQSFLFKSDQSLQSFSVQKGKIIEVPVVNLQCNKALPDTSVFEADWMSGVPQGGAGYALEFKDTDKVIDSEIFNIEGKLELRVLSFSLHSSAQVEIEVLDEKGRLVHGSFHHPAFYDQGGVANMDSVWVGKNLPFGNYIARLKLSGKSRSHDFPYARAVQSDRAFFVLALSLNEKAPALGDFLPWNSKCYQPSNEKIYRSPSVLPERDFFDSKAQVGFCGQIQWRGKGPPPPPSFPALVGWALPWVMMWMSGIFLRVFLLRAHPRELF